MTAAAYPGNETCPPVFDLGCADVHVWSASLPFDAEVGGALFGLLADDERTHSASYRFARDRERYIACRGLLRVLSGQYLRCPAASVRLVYGAHGKPAIDGHCGRLCFNLSHVQDAALIAFAREWELGVDLEPLRPVPEAAAIAAEVFAPAEIAQLRAAPAAARDALFLELWTRREAELKAEGVGFGAAAGSWQRPAGGWRLHPLAPGPGHVGALAVAGDLARLRLTAARMACARPPGGQRTLLLRAGEDGAAITVEREA